MSLVPPIIEFFQFNTREIASPSGARDLINGSFAFERKISKGCLKFDPAQGGLSSGTMIFPGTKFDFSNITLDHLATEPTAVVVHLDSSGVAISNMKLFLAEDTAITIPPQSVGLDPGFVQLNASGTWHYLATMPSGAGERLSLSVPSEANVRRNDGHFGLLGEDDRNTSEFIYLNLVLPVGFPLGNYGVCGSGKLTFQFAFDYFFNGYMLEFGVP